MLAVCFRLLITSLFLGPFLSLLAQSSFPNILLDDDTKGYAPCEPSIAINFTHPDTIVAGAILNKVYYSYDGGKNWESNKLAGEYGVYGDPCLVSDYQGNIYYLHLSNPDGARGWESRKLDRIVCQRSEDGGSSWEVAGFMGNHHPKDQDKEWAVADPQTGALYATWTQFDKYESQEESDRSNILFSRSLDQGETWSPARLLSQVSGDCLDDDQTTEGAVPAVGPEGQVYVSWAVNEKIYFDRSLDGGETWMEEDIEVAKQTGGWTLDIPGILRCNGLPVTVCDLSDSVNRGTLYVNWTDQRNGENDTDVWIAKSTDEGMTWSAPVRVNDDSTSSHQFLSWLTIDQTTGYLYCVFYDRRAYATNKVSNKTDVYLAYSTDGGETFTNVKISEESFTPISWVFFGDYNHISAHMGKIFPIWTRMDSGKTSVWTSNIDAKELMKNP